jgi:hypothetical protein
MFYKIERTFLTDAGGNSARSTDRLPHMIAADSANAAAAAFVARDHGTMLGNISDLPGDKATATAADRGRVFVVFVERASDSINDHRPLYGGDDDETQRRPR